MVDARIAPQAPHITRREDYRAPDWMVPEIALDFDLDPTATRVRAVLKVERNGAHDRPLVLNGDGLAAASVKVDGAEAQGWTMEGPNLVIPLSGDAHQIETEVVIAPERNTQLQGLYASSGMLCTQCEAEGFRRITFFPDRPDVLAATRCGWRATRRASRCCWRTAIRSRRARPRMAGIGPNGTTPSQSRAICSRWSPATWSPIRALHDDDSAARSISASGCAKAICPRPITRWHALKLSMAWDESVYGREYDLDVFNIVAVDDFNFGAMENKGLNIFNSRYILADPDTATDADYDAIAAVVAHEYFHNWSGNRVTCRDWFQLSLKEGFTVFRDQNSRPTRARRRSSGSRMCAAARQPIPRGCRPARAPDPPRPISRSRTSTRRPSTTRAPK
jgi:aminopeptidase N